MQDKKRQLYHEGLEVNEVKPGSAGRLTGFNNCIKQFSRIRLLNYNLKKNLKRLLTGNVSEA